MARPSNRAVRRDEIVLALERVLARAGLGSATIAAVADEAELAPGLVHHHFTDKEELFAELTRSLYGRYCSTIRDLGVCDAMDAALAIRGTRGVRAARAWVGLFAEGLRSVSVLAELRSVIASELRRLDAALIAEGLDPERAREVAPGLLAFVLGALVLGALLPRSRSGFAAPFARELFHAFTRSDRSTPRPRPGR